MPRTRASSGKRSSGLITEPAPKRAYPDVRGDFLETRQVFARPSGVTLALQEPAPSQIQQKRETGRPPAPLEGRDGFPIMLRLRLQCLQIKNRRLRE